MMDKEREKLIIEKIRKEDEAAEQDRQTVKQYLIKYLKEQKSYTDDDIETDKMFDVYVNEGCQGKAYADILIKSSGRYIIAIKCASTSVESRERHVLSFARVAHEFVIPLCVITDGETTRIFDSLSGRVLSEDIRFIPDKRNLDAEDYPEARFPKERAEREKRVLLAFEAVACPSYSESK